MAFSSLAPSENAIRFPTNIHISLPELNFAGQQWIAPQTEIMRDDDGVKLSFSGSELRGDLFVPNTAQPWQVNITYLYFNGASPTEENKSLKMANVPDAKKAVQFSLKDIPAINFACQECWVN